MVVFLQKMQEEKKQSTSLEPSAKQYRKHITIYATVGGEKWKVCHQMWTVCSIPMTLVALEECVCVCVWAGTFLLLFVFLNNLIPQEVLFLSVFFHNHNHQYYTNASAKYCSSVCEKSQSSWLYNILYRVEGTWTFQLGQTLIK